MEGVVEIGFYILDGHVQISCWNRYYLENLDYA
jgi:hypothetical protein